MHASSFSQYQGVFLRQDQSLFKYIDHFSIEATINHVQRDQDELRLTTDNGVVRVEENGGQLIVRSSQAVRIEVVLDMRYIHDYDDQGRLYDVDETGDSLDITYTKYESDDLHVTDYKKRIRMYAADYTCIDEWTPVSQPYDESRGSNTNHWVYRCADATVEQDTPLRIDLPLEDPDDTVMGEHRYSDNGSTRLAAGYPWFYQAWSRDEMISLAPLVHDEPRTAKQIVLRAARHQQGRSSVEGSDLASADTAGWLARRVLQLREHASFSQAEQETITRYLEAYLDSSTTAHGLIHNGPLETWMDTHGGTDDVRAGYRVEIQAGYMAILSVLKSFTDQDVSHRLHRAKEGVQDRLVENHRLHDGYADTTIDKTVRPNVFLAYYLAPQMVKDSVWHNTFDHVIEHCWLPWGGFSSISTEDALFQPYHTGVDNRSYHRGDSWYYVNNIAAIAMNDLAGKEYLKYVERVRRASIRDYEEDFAIGASSEISHASEQQGQGCFSQAWSKATLLELLRRV